MYLNIFLCVVLLYIYIHNNFQMLRNMTNSAPGSSEVRLTQLTMPEMEVGPTEDQGVQPGSGAIANSLQFGPSWNLFNFVFWIWIHMDPTFILLHPWIITNFLKAPSFCLFHQVLRI